MKPFVKWPGGKTSELPIIRPYLHGASRIIEPFAGGGAVFFDQEIPGILNDINRELIAFYAQDDQTFTDFSHAVLHEERQRQRLVSAEIQGEQDFLRTCSTVLGDDCYVHAQKECKRRLQQFKRYGRYDWITGLLAVHYITIRTRWKTGTTRFMCKRCTIKKPLCYGD